jgi:hypothetical protein
MTHGNIFCSEMSEETLKIIARAMLEDPKGMDKRTLGKWYWQSSKNNRGSNYATGNDFDIWGNVFYELSLFKFYRKDLAS